MILLVAMFTRKPLDFAAFPAVLLFATLLAVAERGLDPRGAAARPAPTRRAR